MTMNREEAILHIEKIKEFLTSPKICWSKNDNKIVALDMAIEALENKPTPCEKCIHVKSCRKVIILKNRTYKLIKYCSQGSERREP